MRNTVFAGAVQYMVFQPKDTDPDTGLPIEDKLLGQPKVLKGVLQERGLWRPNFISKKKSAPGFSGPARRACVRLVASLSTSASYHVWKL